MEHKGIIILLIGLVIFSLLVNVVGTTFSFYAAQNNKEEKAETTIIPSNGGGNLSLNNSEISGGYVNVGEVVVSKEVTIYGSISNAKDLSYTLSLNVLNNGYGDGALYYTVTEENVSKNGTTFKSTSSPVAINPDKNVLGVGTFVGPIDSSKPATHKYKIDIIRQVDSAVSGDVKFDANLVVVQGS